MKKTFSALPRLATAALFVLVPACTPAQQALTWDQVKARFEAANPALKADALNVDEMRAQEITANLRPNPQFTQTVDGTQIARNNGVWQPLAGTFVQPAVTYLHERDHKRELRTESAKEGTQIGESQHEDLKRNLEFNLRTAFNNTLQAKAVLDLARADLDYYDHIIRISSDRYHAGDIAQVDLDRIELQRVQYESELQTAMVNLRTAKIQLLQLLNDRTPVEQFDVTGPFDFSEALRPLDDFRQMAIDSRPDLRAALETIQQSQTNHKLAEANGSTDPTFGFDIGRNPPIPAYFGVSVNIPLRIFDRNQGEKARTQIDIGRNEKLREAAQAQVFSDVDSAYWTIVQTVNLMKPYKSKYLELATDTRNKVSFAYQHGGASLLDYLDAEKAYRDTRLAYLTLIGSYLVAAAQMNQAVGREVI